MKKVNLSLIVIASIIFGVVIADSTHVGNLFKPKVSYTNIVINEDTIKVVNTLDYSPSKDSFIINLLKSKPVGFKKQDFNGAIVFYELNFDSIILNARLFPSTKDWFISGKTKNKCSIYLDRKNLAEDNRVSEGTYEALKQKFLKIK